MIVSVNEVFVGVAVEADRYSFDRLLHCANENKAQISSNIAASVGKWQVG